MTRREFHAFLLAPLAQRPGAASRPRRLELFTWNDVDHRLSWVVSEGTMVAGEYVRDGDMASYVIDMDAATMEFNGEKRRFAPEEARHVHGFINQLADYCKESTGWWEAGKGERVKPKGA